MRKSRFFLSFLATLLIISGLTFAQEGSGRLTGTVTDDEGVPLPGVSVVATSPDAVGEATAITGNNGVYRLLALRPGEYQIVFTLSGFKTLTRGGIALRPEQNLTVDVEMEMGALEEEITVIGESPLIDVKNTSKGMTFDKETFQTLPRGRDFQSLAITIPGVNEEPMTGGGLSVDGATGSENQFYVDGVDVTDIDQGRKAQAAAFEFVEEVQMKASGYQAEYGGAIGGVLNVITRSGGNDYHGELISYYSGSALTGKERDTLREELYGDGAEYVNYQDLYGKDKISRIEAGFNLGGYILKDRLWFFASFLPVFNTTERHIEWEADPPVPGSDHVSKEKWFNGSAKITAQPLKGLRVSGSFVNNYYTFRGNLPARAGTDSPNNPWADFGFDYPNWSANASADYTIGNNFLVTARGGMFHQNQTNQQVAPTDPLYRFRHPTPGGMYGTSTTNSMFSEIPADLVHPRGWISYNYNDAFVTNKMVKERYSGNLDFTYYMELGGEHAWKAGVQYVRVHEDLDNTIAYPYFQFAWDYPFVHAAFSPDPIRGTYGYYAVRGGEFTGPYGTFAEAYSNRWAIFLQDSYSPSFIPNLTLNIGIRAEKEDIPSFSDLPEFSYPPIEFGFGDKIAPRMGFVYDVFGNSNTKIFGSFGLYYDVMKLEMAVSGYGGFKWKSDYYTLDDYDYTKATLDNPGALGTYITTLNWRTPSFDTTDPELRPMTQSEISFGLEQKLIDNVSVSARFVYKHLIRAIEDVGVQDNQGETYYTANPGYGFTLNERDGGKFQDFIPTIPPAKRDYMGLNLSIEKRFSDNWMAGASYTFSSLRGTYDGLADRPNVNRTYDLWYMVRDKDMNVNDGPLTTDRPHQFKLFGSYAFDFGLTLGFFASGQSGVPVNRMMSAPEDFTVDGRLSDGRTPFLFFTNIYAEYNLAITDAYRIQLNINVDNVFNIKTARQIFQTLTRSTIGLSDQELAGGLTYDENAQTLTTSEGTVYTWEKDPRFLMEFDYFDPIEVRLGLKFIF